MVPCPSRCAPCRISRNVVIGIGCEEEGLTGGPLDVEELRQGGRDIGEALAHPKIFDPISILHNQGHALASVVRPLKCRIVPMIGRDDQQILRLDLREECAEPCVKFHQRPRIAGRVPTVAKLGVEVHQVDKHQPGLCLRQDALDGAHSLAIVSGEMAFGDAFPGEQVEHLADADDGQACIPNRIENGARRLE